MQRLIIKHPYSQTFLVEFYQYVLVIMVGGGCLFAVIFKGKGALAGLFHAEVRDTTGCSKEMYTQQRSISLYVPELVNPFQVNPLLACDMSSVDSRHLTWVGDFEENNLFTYAQKQATGECEAYVTKN